MSASSRTQTAIQSMTGFGTAEGSIGEQKYRVEVKAVNHRFLDMKVRLPRELQSAEIALKAALTARFSRGAIDLKVDRMGETGATNAAAKIQVNLGVAKAYYDALLDVKSALGLTDTVRATEIAAFPDVFARTSGEMSAEEQWNALSPLVNKAFDGLAEMRTHEGSNLVKILTAAATELEAKISLLRKKREAVSEKYPERIREKIKAIFEAHPLDSGNIQAVLESRISQELAMLADRTDIEEELARFQGHLDHLRKILKEGGQVGRKLDFVLQELGREINTLGNKAQDYGMSEEVVGVKVRLEQLREQVMNIE